MDPIIGATSSDPADAATFASGLASAFSIRAADSSDVFRCAEAAATCNVALLEYADHAAVQPVILNLATQSLDLTSAAIEETARLLKRNEYALLSDDTAFGDLFYLPMRLSRILGWIGAQHYIGQWAGGTDALGRGLLMLLGRS